MQVKVADISIKKRIRKNLGDLSQLMESMKTHGLMNPVVITSDKTLIAGNRRLESARRLGWETIDVHIIKDLSEINKIEMELDENIHRRNLTPEELTDGYTLLERMKNPGFFRRIWNLIVRFFKWLFRIN